MYGLLDGPSEGVPQDPGVDPYDLRANTAYTLFRGARRTTVGYRRILDVSTLKVDQASARRSDTACGSRRFPAASLKAQREPARCRLSLLGNECRQRRRSRAASSSRSRDRRSRDGTPQPRDLGPDRCDQRRPVLGRSWSRGRAGSSPGRRPPRSPRSAPRASRAYLEGALNDRLASGLRRAPGPGPGSRASDAPARGAPRPQARASRARTCCSSTSRRSSPSRSHGPSYAGVIGRQYVDLGIGGIRFTPQSLGDTWAAGNLAKSSTSWS